MAQEVLYRKWRPNRFSEVFGHDAVVQTLRNAIKSDRISHAYMFSGPRGTGKTTLARILSKAVNCESTVDGDVCDQCSSCVAHDTGRAIDLIEIDSADGSGATGIRELADKAMYVPVNTRYKVYILDEVHAFSQVAFTALLKILEEPPPHVIFAFATTAVDKVIPTVLSRSQRFDLSRIPMNIVIKRLTQIADSEGFTIEDASYKLIARYATGSLRDAVNALDRVTASFGPSPNVEDVRASLGLSMDDRAIGITVSIFGYDLKSSLMSVNSAVADGVNIRKLTSDIVLVMRAVLLTKAGAAEELEFNEDLLSAIEQLAKDEAITVDQIIVALESLTRVASSKYLGSEFEPLPLEIAISSLALAKHEIEIQPNNIGRSVRTQEPARPASTVDVAANLERSNLKEVSSASDEAISEQPERGASQADPAISPEIVSTSSTPEIVSAPPAPEIVSTPSAPEIVSAPPASEIVSTPSVLDLNRICGDWDLVKEHIRETSKPAEALLATAFPKSLDGKNLEIGFLHQSHLQNFLDRKKAIAGVVLVDALATSVAQVFEDSLTISFSHWPDMQQEGRDVTASEPPSAGHLLSEALSLGGTLIEQE
jgi:DNA polymerase-3 subunit gamma/tau